MGNEYLDRQRAIQMRLAGQTVETICRSLKRSRVWFRKWWSRYLELGPDGLFDLTHANHQVTRRISPELERMVLTIRRRLEARAQPDTRDHSARTPRGAPGAPLGIFTRTTASSPASR